MVTTFTLSPVLQHFGRERVVIIKTDASDYLSSGVLSQYDDEGVVHQIAYYGKIHTLAECIDDTYDKELIAIFSVLAEWRPECKGAAYPHQLVTDYRNLQFSMMKMILNQRQP